MTHTFAQHSQSVAHKSRFWPIVACLLESVFALSVLPGCQLFAAMEESRRRTSTHSVDATYTGLANKSFAVLVTADRAILAEYPTLVDTMTDRIIQKLSQPSNVPAAGGFIKSGPTKSYVYRNPGWIAKPMSDLAQELGGVQRIILIEVSDFRLHEPGNSYEWKGVANFTASVYEIDGPAPDESAFTKIQTVDFPDKGGVSVDEMPQTVVASALLGRTIDRASWLFYKHEEPYYPDY